MPTRFELWKQAIEQMEHAIAELDQAHATMKDCRLDDVDAGGYRMPTIKHLVSDAEGLLRELRTAECDDCGHAIAKHGDRYGCEYERGDVPMNCRDGGTIMAAAGPCHCKWGLQEAKG
jgi:ribosomal protein S27AE